MNKLVIRKVLSAIVIVLVVIAALYVYLVAEPSTMSEEVETAGEIVEEIAEEAETADDIDPMMIPLCKGGKDHERRNYHGYSICYRESYEQAEWAAECLTREKLQRKVNRSENFRPDEGISTGSADTSDYYGSGYDRGHLVPAGDMGWDSEAMNDTFLMSNMSPQNHKFNSGIWNDLEMQVRNWAKKFGTIYIVTGPVLESGKKYKVIGKNKVAVPELYYKVLLAHTDSGEWQAIAFVIPNEGSDDSFMDYTVSIDDVESLTGLDFFAPLEDSIENKVESEYSLKFWKIR